MDMTTNEVIKAIMNDASSIAWAIEQSKQRARLRTNPEPFVIEVDCNEREWITLKSDLGEEEHSDLFPKTLKSEDIPY